MCDKIKKYLRWPVGITLKFRPHKISWFGPLSRQRRAGGLCTLHNSCKSGNGFLISNGEQCKAIAIVATTAKGSQNNKNFSFPPFNHSRTDTKSSSFSFTCKVTQIPQMLFLFSKNQCLFHVSQQ
jgi:hypothetical protein